jgi:beta-glucosidase
MTSYNRVNGRWAASNYDLTTRLLRNDFGFDGFVMTDWWAKVNDENDNPCDTNLAAMVHAMNDIYMVTPDAMARKDNLPDSLAEGTLTRGELQICAINLIRFALDSLSYMAQIEGYGKRDLKAACEDKEPKYTSPVVDGKAAIYSGIARKAVLRVTFVSDTDTLVQTNVSLHVNTKNVDAFIVGGTDGGTVTDYREISLVAGNNEFVFTSGDSKARAVNVELFA